MTEFPSRVYYQVRYKTPTSNNQFRKVTFDGRAPNNLSDADRELSNIKNELDRNPNAFSKVELVEITERVLKTLDTAMPDKTQLEQ